MLMMMGVVETMMIAPTLTVNFSSHSGVSVSTIVLVFALKSPSCDRGEQGERSEQRAGGGVGAPGCSVMRPAS